LGWVWTWDRSSPTSEIFTLRRFVWKISPPFL
jgi:hypothetical protein